MEEMEEMEGTFANRGCVCGTPGLGTQRLFGANALPICFCLSAVV